MLLGDREIHLFHAVLDLDLYGQIYAGLWQLSAVCVSFPSQGTISITLVGLEFVLGGPSEMTFVSLEPQLPYLLEASLTNQRLWLSL